MAMDWQDNSSSRFQTSECNELSLAYNVTEAEFVYLEQWWYKIYKNKSVVNENPHKLTNILLRMHNINKTVFEILIHLQIFYHIHKDIRNSKRKIRNDSKQGVISHHI